MIESLGNLLNTRQRVLSFTIFFASWCWIALVLFAPIIFALLFAKYAVENHERLGLKLTSILAILSVVAGGAINVRWGFFLMQYI